MEGAGGTPITSGVLSCDQLTLTSRYSGRVNWSEAPVPPPNSALLPYNIPAQLNAQIFSERSPKSKGSLLVEWPPHHGGPFRHSGGDRRNTPDTGPSPMGGATVSGAVWRARGCTARSGPLI